MSRKSDAFQNWCAAEKLRLIPRIAATAFQAGWNAAVENVIETIRKEAPLSGGTEQQRRDICQDQYNEIGRILQCWGYDIWDICNVAVAIKRVLSSEHEQSS